MSHGPATDTRLRTLPGFSPLYLDFVEGAPGALGLLPARTDLGFLSSLAPFLSAVSPDCGGTIRILMENLQETNASGASSPAISNLRAGRCVTVASIHVPALFGGPFSELLKALTAAGLAAKLNRSGVAAAAVCCIGAAGPKPAAHQTAGFRDREGGFYEHVFPLEGGPQQEAVRLTGGVTDFLERFDSRLGTDIRGTDIYRIVKQSHLPGALLNTAWGTVYRALLAGRGTVALDLAQPALQELRRPVIEDKRENLRRVVGDFYRRLRCAGYGPVPSREDLDDCLAPGSVCDAVLMLSAAFPIAVVIAGPEQLPDIGAASACASILQRRSVLLCHRASATIADRRSLAILTRHGIAFEDIFVDVETLLRRIGYGTSGDGAAQALGAMEVDMQESFSRLACLLRPQQANRAKVRKIRTRARHQLRRLAERTARARLRRSDDMRRQLEKVCGKLAPNGRLQESQLTTMQVLAEHSPAAVKAIGDRLDIQDSNHQIIALD